MGGRGGRVDGWEGDGRRRSVTASISWKLMMESLVRAVLIMECLVIPVPK